MRRFEKLAELAKLDIRYLENFIDEDIAEKLHKFWKLAVADCINVVAENTAKNKPTQLSELYELDSEVTL